MKTEWRAIETAPKVLLKEPKSESRFDILMTGPVILVTNGTHFAAGQFCVRIQGPIALRGYVDGKITPAFTEEISNPEEGKETAFWSVFGCSAFTACADVSDYDGPLFFTPTHWMPLPEPPEIMP